MKVLAGVEGYIDEKGVRGGQATIRPLLDSERRGVLEWRKVAHWNLNFSDSKSCQSGSVQSVMKNGFSGLPAE